MFILSQIGSLHAHEPDISIVVYDLGERPPAARILLIAAQDWTRCSVRLRAHGEML
jgi:hypothetical protein